MECGRQLVQPPGGKSYNERQAEYRIDLVEATRCSHSSSNIGESDDPDLHDAPQSRVLVTVVTIVDHNIIDPAEHKSEALTYITFVWAQHTIRQIQLRPNQAAMRTYA